ncbi:MAG: hypothetical protein M9957_04390 [Rhodobacteraceae bacterium]|nr:hypothetical protein [Paracoccaceae bacterium]
MRDKVTMLRRAELEATGQLARIEAEILEIDEMRQKFQTRSSTRRATNTARRRWRSFRRSRQRRKASANRSRKAANVLNRTEVLAVSGTVVRLYYHTSGGVIETGRAIAGSCPTMRP